MCRLLGDSTRLPCLRDSGKQVVTPSPPLYFQIDNPPGRKDRELSLEPEDNSASSQILLRLSRWRSCTTRARHGWIHVVFLSSLPRLGGPSIAMTPEYTLRVTASSRPVSGSLTWVCPTTHVARISKPWVGTRSKRGGAVLSNGSCRDLRVTGSIIAIQTIPARDLLWDAQKRSRRPADRRSCRWIELPDTLRGHSVYLGFSSSSGYRYAPTIG